jgi:ribosomal protein S21
LDGPRTKWRNRRIYTKESRKRVDKDTKGHRRLEKLRSKDDNTG